MRWRERWETHGVRWEPEAKYIVDPEQQRCQSASSGANQRYSVETQDSPFRRVESGPQMRECVEAEFAFVGSG
jgi:hypothetical protein